MRLSLLILLAGTSLLTACGGSSEPDYNPAVSDADHELGAKQHPQLLAEFGGAYPGEESSYVARIGESLARSADLGGQCTFTLVNSDVVNAFAVPGCYIYVTRGLLGLVNSEAELASVMSHELGHIVADHSGRQQSRSLFRQLGVIAVSLVTGSPTLTRIAGQAAQFFTLRYSRKQEYEADDLGIRFMRTAGYDPYEAADMLSALARQEQFLTSTSGRDTAKSMPEWTRTHPLTENRIERARTEARATGLADNELPEQTSRYMGEVDGLLYGDDPQQGFVLGRRFLHPVMRIGFEAPEGFTLTNSPQAILLEGPDGMRGEFAGGALPTNGLPGYVDALLGQMLGQTRAQVGPAERGEAHGIPMLIVPVLVQAERGPMRITVAAYEAPNGAAYHFILASSADAPTAPLIGLFRSFHFLSDQEAASLRPRQIHTVRANAGDTIDTLARQMADDHPRELLLMLNGLDPGQSLRPGEQVKIVTYAN